MGIGTGTAALIGGLASAGAGIAGSAMQASAAGNAAQAQSNAAARAMGIAGTNLQSAVGPQMAATQAIQGFYQPYTQLGQQGAQSLAQALAPQGSLAQGWTQQFQAPTAAQAQAMPNYQFALQQGLGAIQSGAAAQGNLLSGGTQKALANYATGLASQTYQQSYNNALSGYQQNYQTWYNNQQNLFNRLYGLTSLGAGTTGQMAGLTQQGVQNLANIYGTNTQVMAQLLGAQGAAQASGSVGTANALAGGLNSFAGGVGQGLMGYAMGNQGGYNPSGTPNLYQIGYGANGLATPTSLAANTGTLSESLGMPSGGGVTPGFPVPFF